MLPDPKTWLCFLLAAYFLTAFAQVGQEATKKKSAKVAVVGCLRNGKALDRFDLAGKDGKVYSLRSASVRLGEHVGQTVSVEGHLKHDQKRDDYDFEGSEVTEGYGKSKAPEPVDVVVTSLKMLSASCHRP